MAPIESTERTSKGGSTRRTRARTDRPIREPGSEAALGIAEFARNQPGRGALVGAGISAIFGVVWTEWAASGLVGSAAPAVRIVGLVVAVLVVCWCASLLAAGQWVNGPVSRGTARRGSTSMFSSPRYLLVVAVEVVAIGGGNKVLTATGHTKYAIVLAAIVVGTHFVALGWLFFGGFYWLGGALIFAGLMGTVVGLAGGEVGAVKASTGLIAATSLFGSGGWALAAQSRARRGAVRGAPLEVS